MYLIGCIVLSVLLVGFFTGIQVAFVNLNRLNVELKKKQGKSSGILFSGFLEEPSRFIGITLVGFNIFLVVYGLLIGASLHPFWNWLITKWHLPSAYINVIKFLFETLTSWFIILLLGEFIPRAVWKSNNEWLLSGFISRIVNFFYQLLNPIATILVSVSEGILKYFFNVRINDKKDAFSRADLEYFLQQTKEQDIDNQELNTELFENALTLPTIKVRQCLVPRKEIEGIDLSISIEEVKKKFTLTKLSKLVVFENNIDHIAGYIHQLDLFKKPTDIKSILLPIPAVPESMNVTDLINKFTKERKSIAWVVDEFGGTAGIVTMEDLLEEIFGEIKDEYDTEEFEEKKLSDDEYVLSGRLELDYLHEKYGLEFSEIESETLSGYIIHHHETIPKVKDRIIIDNHEFDIISVSDTRIEMVRVKILTR
jgi:CBS domain containing-hemolysin-like protein